MMKYLILITAMILLYSCKNQETPQLIQKQEVNNKKEDTKQEVKIQLSVPNENKPESKIVETDWIEQDSLLIVKFVESLLVKNQVKFNNYLDFFGEHSEFEVEELISKFGDEAEEKSQLIYSDVTKHNSLSLEKVRTKILSKIGTYQSIEHLRFDKKNIDINYFAINLQGTDLIEKYNILTNSSEGRSHYIIDVLINNKSIINNKSYR